MSDSLFIEIGTHQQQKNGEDCFGDTGFSQKIPEEQRIISILSDGLGSGVKANILSSMTTRMAMKFVESNMELLRSSEVMMDALPICQVRKISYATFSIVDSEPAAKTRIIATATPPPLFLRHFKPLTVKCRELSSPKWKDRTISISQVTTQPEDRIIMVSDGVTQAGLGNRKYPLGWGRQGCLDFILKEIRKNPYVSAHDLARAVVHEALDKEVEHKAGDDISCVVLYFRKPRKLLVLTGPPFDEDKDREFAELVSSYDGKTVICGGTTANIVERELCLKCEIDKTSFDDKIPMASIMDGVDLVTEGILTLTEVYRMLKEGIDKNKNNAAVRLAKLLLDSDRIDFVVGTKINIAHQDPSLPMELEIRRNIVKKIFRLLQSQYLKEISVRYI